MTDKGKGAVRVAHRVWTIVGIMLCVILLPVLVVNLTLIAKGYARPDEVPTIGGTAPLIVLTDSMYPEIQSGDLVIVSSADPSSVAVGDIISFYDPASEGTVVVTHRVDAVTTDGNGLAWRTKGDANNAADADLVPAANLVGVCQCRIAGVGNIAMFMQSSAGLVACVVIPLLLLVGYDVARRGLYEKKRASEQEELRAELEQLRREKSLK